MKLIRFFRSRPLWIKLLLALIPIGLCGLIGRYFWVSRPVRYTALPSPNQAEMAAQSISTTQVIVALQPISRGSEFVAGSIGRRDWPANNVPPETIADEAETIGRVAKIDIVQGQVIVRSMLVDHSGVGNAGLSDLTNTRAAAGPMTQISPRQIIYTGSMQLVVKNTQAAVAAITELVDKMGGYVSASNIFHTGNDVLQGSVSIRVPSEHYTEMLTELRALGVRVEHEESTSQDMTEEFIDLQAHLANYRAGEAAMQKLLDERQQVSKISDVIEVQQKMAEIRGQIEQIEGRLRYLTDQAVLSTINVELIPEVSPPAPKPTPTSTPRPTPLPSWHPNEVASDASQTLLFSMQRTINGLIWIIIVWLPLVIIYLLPVAFGVWLVRPVWKRFGFSKNE